MSASKDAFKKGVSAFRAGKTEEALHHFTKAIKDGANDVAVYDSRAAVLEKLGRHRDALADSRKVIELNPDRWQGYSRSARLFEQLGKPDSAKTMVKMALKKIRPGESQRREDLMSLLQRVREGKAKRVEAQPPKKIYHFGSLPVEVADTIFHMTLEDHPSRVVSLAAVCRGWRTTLHQNPSYWTTLYLVSRRPERKAKLWIKRSKGKLKGLHLLGRTDDMALCLQELKNTPLDHLRSLTISNVSMSTVRSALSPTVVASLTDIKLKDIVPCPDNSWLWQHENLQLRSISTNDQLDWLALSQHCAHLRTISFRSFIPLQRDSGEVLIELCRSNPSLEELEICVTAGGIMPTSFAQEPCLVDMVHLKKICLGGRDMTAPSVLGRLSLPSLASLRLEWTFTRMAFSSVAARGGAKTLQELVLLGCTINPSELILFLSETGNLRLLDIQHNDKIQEVSEALASPRQEGPMCPALTHINFSHSPLRAGPVVQIVKSRLQREEETTVKVASIQSIIMDDCPHVDENVLPWLRSNVPIVSCVYMTKKEAKRKR
ncbi:hypothetical protein BXZ70DRAFT_908130 [Cristinia sonorae]|uniref:F-box domain-containing protein n=1 Tax=Cristinia sonorae TaxID=1940300 RepID=A0A8K0UL73_9AGAR|nr:hypothetical protein BXZ70DRAFT_908130 [Cristinia sonorae]